MKFKNPFNNEEQEKLNYDIFKKMYIDSQETFEVFGCKLYNNDTYFKLPDKMKRIAFKRNQKDKLEKIPLFSVQQYIRITIIISSTMERKTDT